MRSVHSDVSIRPVSHMQVLRCLFVHTFCYLLVALVAQDKEAINQLKENKSRVHYHFHAKDY